MTQNRPKAGPIKPKSANRGGRRSPFRALPTVRAVGMPKSVGSSMCPATKAAKHEIIQSAAQYGEGFLNSDLYQVSLSMLISAKEDRGIADKVRAISAQNRASIENAWIDRTAGLGLCRSDAEAVHGLLGAIQRGLVIEHRIEGYSRASNRKRLGIAMSQLRRFLDKKIQNPE